MNYYDVIWDGRHGNQDRDLFHPVDWLEQKEKPVTIPGGRSASRIPTPRTRKHWHDDRDLAIALKRRVG